MSSRPETISEPEKYRRCYLVPEYKMGPRRLVHAMRNMELMDVSLSYLDVACGRGEVVRAARERGMDAVGLDFVKDLCDDVIVIHGNMLRLPFDANEFDYVSCYDAVEHLPTDQVDKALDELFRVCRMELVISTNSQTSMLEGMELHLTREPRVWWEKKLAVRAFDRDWRVEFMGFANPQSDWSWRMS